MLVKYSFVNGEKAEVEVSEDIGLAIVDMERKENNLERNARRHCYSMDAAVYQGKDYASNENVLSDLINREERSRLFEGINNLPEPQRHRFIRYTEGMSMREIARQDGVGYNAVCDSIKLAKRNLKKFLNLTGQNRL